MKDYKELIKDFPKDREEKLRNIRRYSMFEVFYYRSTLWHHNIRVFFIVNELLDLAKDILPSIDADKAQLLALVHDDAEIITGDIQLGHKQIMTQEQLQAVEKNEADAIEKLSELYPKEINGYKYKDLLLNALHKDTTESQLVSYADKLDAYCESLHEVFGGNISALRAVINYVRVLKDFNEKFPALKPLFNKKDSFLITTESYGDVFKINKKDYIHVGRPHSLETIHINTEFILYNKWKILVLENLGNEGVEILTKQTEALY